MWRRSLRVARAPPRQWPRRPLSAQPPPQEASVWRTIFSRRGGPTAAAAQGAGSGESPARPLDRSSWKDIVRVLRTARPEYPLMGLGAGCLVVAAGITMYVPTGFGAIVDIVSGARTDVSLSEYTLRLCGLLAVGGVANFGRITCFNFAGQRLIARLRRNLFDSVLRHEVAFFEHHRTGELISRLSADTEVMARSMTGVQLSMGLRSVAQGVAGVGYMAYMSPQLTATVLGLVPVVLGGAYAYGRFVRGLSTRTQDALSAATAFAEERIANVRTVKAFAQEDAERRRYAERVERVLELGQKEALANGGFFAAASFVGSLCLLAVLFRGGLLVAAGQLTAGVLTSFLLYSLYVGASFLSVSSFYGELMKGLGASHRYFSILGPRDPPQSGERRAAGPTLPNLRGSISFEDVHLQYDQRARVLHGIDLEVPAGKTVAVVGESGAGKSSLAYLLLRFFAPVQGTIRIDGVPLDTLDRDWLRRQIGYVPQEPALFSGTIRDNIAYGVEHCTQEEVERAAREANADIFIRAFPHGYDTLVGERGASLSGGQKQRIAIARAILKNPRILILDEATSALDAESEELVQEALGRLMKNRTVLVIAHRLSTIMRADAIAVLKHGKIVEFGTHDQLLARPEHGSVYRRLVKLQLSDKKPPGAAKASRHDDAGP